MSFFLHLFAPIGDIFNVKCTACGHSTRSHHAINYGAWRCDDCGGRCTSAIKKQAFHMLHEVSKSLNIACTNCGHYTKDHETVRYGAWECKKCGKTCVA